MLFEDTMDFDSLKGWTDRYMNRIRPFSFLFGGHAPDFLVVPKKTERCQADVGRIKTETVWYDKNSGLAVRLETVEYENFPVVEWIVYIKNNGGVPTPNIKNLYALDAEFEAESFTLRGANGEWCAAESYAPYCHALEQGIRKRFAPQDGKSTKGPDGWPYYNLQMQGGGVIFAIGWPGQWECVFERDGTNKLRVTAGQEETDLFLLPGEEIRTPLVAMLFWKGEDFAAAQNLWRRWFSEHVAPPRGARPLTQIQTGADSVDDMIAAAQKYLAAGIAPDVCWNDAGWYPKDGGPFKGAASWVNTGTWEPDPARYPEGFRKFSDWVHGKGMEFLLWFEPERVGDPNSFLAKNHSDWLLDTTDTTGKIFNLGNPFALDWLINHIDSMIKSQGLDWYREDMNGVGPLPAWRQNDGANRKGITENFYVQGHLAFWDELVRKNPGLCIDSCASGGMRNDLETMRRALPLLRSDYQFPEGIHEDFFHLDVYEANQAHTHGLSSWIPFYGSGVYSIENYEARSFYMPAFGAVPPRDWHADESKTAMLRQAYGECKTVAPYMLCDYYPLTEHSLDNSRWIAWQFDRPQHSDGIVQAFRRKDCPDAQKIFALKNICPEADYEVSVLGGKNVRLTGGELKKGLRVETSKPRSAEIIFYRKIDGK